MLSKNVIVNVVVYLTSRYPCPFKQPSTILSNHFVALFPKSFSETTVPCIQVDSSCYTIAQWLLYVLFTFNKYAYLLGLIIRQALENAGHVKLKIAGFSEILYPQKNIRNDSYRQNSLILERKLAIFDSWFYRCHSTKKLLLRPRMLCLKFGEHFILGHWILEYSILYFRKSQIIYV